MTTSSHASATAQADELKRNLLLPAAAEVDAALELPRTHWSALADAGLFGTLAADNPVDTTVSIGETLSGACLATAFVWAQHQGTLMRLIQMPDHAVSQRFLTPLLAGTLRGGVCYAGLLSHGETLSVTNGGLVGTAPFITGWSELDVINLWAYDPANEQAVCYAIEQPATLPGATFKRLSLIAANASNTVSVQFDGMPTSRMTLLQTIPREAGAGTPVIERRRNATLPLGLLIGICENMDSQSASGWLATVDRLRDCLDTAMGENSTAAMVEARGRLLAATQLAAGSLFLAGGSKSASATSLSSRRVREAAFVQASATMSDERDYARKVLGARTHQ